MAGTEDTIRKFLDGETDAFTGLMRQWETKVFNLAWRLLGNREDAQDVVQDTFLSVFQSLKNLRDPKSFPTWVYRITLNHCRGRWRSRVPEVSFDGPMPIPDTKDSTAAIESLLAERPRDPVEAQDLIRKSLVGLSEDHRTAVILKEYLGLSLEEVAVVMECPLSTAKSRVYHGLRGIQKNLKRLL